MKKGKMELMIDIPENINELFEDENLDATPSETPYKGTLTESQM